MWSLPWRNRSTYRLRLSPNLHNRYCHRAFQFIRNAVQGRVVSGGNFIPRLQAIYSEIIASCIWVPLPCRVRIQVSTSNATEAPREFLASWIKRFVSPLTLNRNRPNNFPLCDTRLAACKNFSKVLSIIFHSRKSSLESSRCRKRQKPAYKVEDGFQ